MLTALIGVFVGAIPPLWNIFHNISQIRMEEERARIAQAELDHTFVLRLYDVGRKQADRYSLLDYLLNVSNNERIRAWAQRKVDEEQQVAVNERALIGAIAGADSYEDRVAASNALLASPQDREIRVWAEAQLESANTSLEKGRTNIPAVDRVLPARVFAIDQSYAQARRVIDRSRPVAKCDKVSFVVFKPFASDKGPDDYPNLAEEMHQKCLDTLQPSVSRWNIWFKGKSLTCFCDDS